MSFFPSIKDNQKQFFKKIKQQQVQAQKKRKTEEASLKLTAAIQKHLSNRKHIGPIIKQAEQKIQAILIRKKEIDGDKFSRMMSNAVYKMPILMSPLSLVTVQSLNTYQIYVLKLIEALTHQGRNNPVIRKLLEGNDVKTVQIIKLARFAVILAKSHQECQKFLTEYIRESTTIQTQPNPIVSLITSQTIQPLKQIIIQGRLNPDNQNLFLNQVLLKHLNLFSKSLDTLQVFNMLLDIPSIQPTMVQRLSSMIDVDNQLSPRIKQHILSQDLKHLDILCQKSIGLLSRLISSSAYFLPFAKVLQIHNKILDSYYKMVIHHINHKLYGKKMVMEDQDEQKERYAKVRRTQEYTQFLDGVNLEFYFGPLLEVFKVSIIQSTVSTRYQSTLYGLCLTYLLLQEIFKKTHTKIFNKLNNIETLVELYKLIQKVNILKTDFKSRGKDVVLIQLFMVSTYHRFCELDDMEFQSSKTSFNKNQLPGIVRMLLKLTVILVKQSISNQLFQYTVLLVNDIYKKVFRTKIITLKVFESENLDQYLQNFYTTKKESQNIQTLLKSIPFAFSFETRLLKLREFIKKDKKNYNRNLHQDEQYDNDHTVQIRRGYQFNDAFDQLSKREMRQKYKIVFINQQGMEEEGVDGGGIIKELINSIIKIAFNQIYGLFLQTTLKEIIPNPNLNSIANNNKLEFEFIGKLVGKAIYENILIEPKFAGPFLNIMIGKTNSFQDLQFLDKGLYNTLIHIKHTDQDISQSFLTFSFFETDSNGITRVVQLKENGSNIAVADSNKLEFVMAYADYKVNREFYQQGRLFRRGLTQIIQEQWLEMFNYQELNLMISGNNTNFDIQDLINNTVYNQYKQNDNTIRYFWEVLSQMTLEDKSLFLLYVTSCSRPPTLGFKQLKPKFCISRSTQDTGYLPIAQTCMNLLRLPNYNNKKLLKEKLEYAIKSKAGFQVV